MKLALLLVILAGLTFSAAALAGPKTTAPSNKVTVLVVINDKAIKVYSFVALGKDANGKDAGNDPSSTQALHGPVPRGDYLSFNIFNRGKKPHDFTIFGKKTAAIKPGRTAHLFAQATTRGSFLYRSTTDRGKGFKGYFTVF